MSKQNPWRNFKDEIWQRKTHKAVGASKAGHSGWLFSWLVFHAIAETGEIVIASATGQPIARLLLFKLM